MELHRARAASQRLFAEVVKRRWAISMDVSYLLYDEEGALRFLYLPFAFDVGSDMQVRTNRVCLISRWR